MADDVNLSRQSLRDLAELMGSNRQMTSNVGSNTSGSSGGMPPLFDKLRGELDPMSLAFRGVTQAYDAGTRVFGSVKGIVDENIKSFETLSKSGMNFSGDLGQLSAANYSMRMTQQEFQEVMSENSKRFGALGGSATRGAEAFVNLSKSMYDNGVMEEFRQLGISSKDLNESLATTISMQGATAGNDEKSKQRAIESFKDLNREMNSLSQLTGQSRKEQEEKLNLAKTDGQVESKFRLIGIQQGAEAEKLARDNYAKNLMAAQATGTDQVFKEGFLGIGAQSEKAQAQLQATQGAGMAALKQGTALANGDIKEAGKQSQRVFEETQKNSRNVGILTMGILGDNAGALGKEIGDVQMKTKSYTDAIEAIKKEEAFKGKTEGELHEEALKRVAKANAGQNAAGEQVDGVKNAAVALQNRIGDVNSSFANGLIVPLMRDVRPRLQAFADGALSPRVRDSQNRTGTTSFATQTERDLKDSYMGQVRRLSQDGGGGEGGRPPRPLDRDRPNSNTSDITSGIGQIIGNISAITTQTVDKLIIGSPLPQPTRGTGTIGETGFPTELQDVVAQLHKGEMVLTPEQQKNFLTNAKSSGIQDVMSKMSSMTGKGAEGGLSDMIKEATSAAAKAQQSAPMSAAAGTKEMTLSDVVSSLQTLNNTMMEMLSQNEMLSTKQYKATKGLSGNLFA